MDCGELEAHLTDFLEGQLAPATEAAALEHIATCERCEAVLAGTRSVIELATQMGRVRLEGADREQLLQEILKATRPGEVPDGDPGSGRAFRLGGEVG